MENEGTVKELTVQTVNPSQVMRRFVRAATIRAVRTMAQTAASLMGAKALISDVDWTPLISATVMSGILSLLTSIYSGLPEMEVTEIQPENKGREGKANERSESPRKDCGHPSALGGPQGK